MNKGSKTNPLPRPMGQKEGIRRAQGQLLIELRDEFFYTV